MSTLGIFLLGPPLVEIDGARLEIKPRKAFALLIFLALAGDQQRRDTLAAFFWPEANQRAARASLRRRLSELSALLGKGWLEINSESIGLQTPFGPDAELWLDVHEFQQKLHECQTHGHSGAEVCPACIAPLTQAVALYRGDFAGGFTLQDSPSFDEWQFFQTESLRQALASALERLVRWHSAQAEPGTAIPFARTWLALDPLHEPVHRWLMQLYATLGQRSAALHQYAECQRLLAEALNVTPEEATQALYLELKSSAKMASALPPAAVNAAQARIHVVDHVIGHVIDHVNGHINDKAASLLPSPHFTEENSSTESPAIFVGRARELTVLDEALEIARTGHGQLRFVTGEAGQGKSMLLQEFVRRAQSADPELLAVTGNCHAYTGYGDPYLPFREALALLVGEVEVNAAGSRPASDQARHLRAALPITLPALVEYASDLIGHFVAAQSLLSRATTFASPQSPWFKQLTTLCAGVQTVPLEERLIFSQYAAALKAIAANKPLLIILEDLHWVDLASSGLLFHLSRAIRESRILIVGSYRPDEVAQSRGNDQHPLAGMVAEFKRQHGAIWLDLDNLSPSESRHFVDAFIDTQPNHLDREFRAALFQHTGGHALFTVELLNAMQTRGDLHQDDSGFWIGGDSLDWQTLPVKVEGVIQKQLAHLDDTALSILRVASVLGESFAAEVIAQILHLDAQTLVRRLSQELGRKRHLVISQDLAWLGTQRLSRYSFRHYLFQHYLYQSLDEMERTYLHEAAGNALESIFGEQSAEIAVQLAYHFQQAGLIKKATDALLLAGDRAIQLAAPQEAIRHFTQGLALLPTLPDTQSRARQELEYLLALGNAMDTAGNFDSYEIERVYLSARALCEQLGESAQLWPVLGLLASVNFMRGEYHQFHVYAEEVLRISLEQADLEPRLAAYQLMGIALQGLGDFITSTAYFQSMLALYPQSQPEDIIYGRRMYAHAHLAENRWLAGYPDQSLEYSKRALKIATEMEHPYNLTMALYQSAWLHDMRREVSQTSTQAATVVRLATEHQFVFLLSHGRIYEGCALIGQGEAERGLANLRQGIAELRAYSKYMAKSRFATMLARGYTVLGQSQAGLEVIDAALAEVDASGEHWFDAELHRLKGVLLQMQGAPAQIIEDCFEQAIGIARRQQAKMWELRATVSLCRLWQAQGQSALAHARLAEIYSWFTEGFDTPDLLEAQSLLAELATQS